MLFFSFTFAAFLGLIYNIIKLSSFKVIVYNQQWNEAWDMLEFGGWLMFSLTTMFAWTSVFFIMIYNTKLQKEHERLLKAQTLAKDAQLQMLRYQLNPHFMFNSMNAISTLILKNENDKANEMLDKLWAMFHNTVVPHMQRPKFAVYLALHYFLYTKRDNVTNTLLPHLSFFHLSSP